MHGLSQTWHQWCNNMRLSPLSRKISSTEKLTPLQTLHRSHIDVRILLSPLISHLTDAQILEQLHFRNNRKCEADRMQCYVCGGKLLQVWSSCNVQQMRHGGREAHNATDRSSTPLLPPFPEARLKPSWQKYQRLAIGC